MKITERGWAGHFICGHRCLFRRNTLLEQDDTRIVVSTVGDMRNINGEGSETIGCDRYYETMAFTAKWEKPYWEADVEHQLGFDSPWAIDKCERDTDQRANEMHEMVVLEFSDKLRKRAILQEG